MRRTLRFLLPICLIGVLGVTVAACGGDDEDGSLPTNAVAAVDTTTITKDQFEHWMQVIAAQSAQQSGLTGAAAEVPDSPEFTKCVAARKEAAPDPGKGQPTTTDAQYKTQCEDTYKQMKDAIVGFLISSQWIEQEAAARNVKVTDAEVEKGLKSFREQSFPDDEKAYDKYLQDSRMTEEDVFFQQRLELMQTKLQEAIIKGKDKVSDAQIQAYYDKNKQQFATPEMRDVRIVLTKTEGEAEDAKAALEDGQPWKDVAKEFSIDDASKNTGGLLQGIAKGQQEKALDDAIFGADKGEVGGPVKTQFGWYVYEVDKITPAKQQTLEDTKDTIKQIVASEEQQKALTAFSDRFEKDFKAKTDCRSGFVVQQCSNAPKVDTTTAATAPAQPNTTAGG